MVPGFEAAGILFFKSPVLFQGFRPFHGKGDGFNLVVGTVNSFIRRVGNCAQAGHIGLVGTVYTYHTVGYVSDINPFAHQLFRVLGEQFLGLGRAHHYGFPLFADVVRIQETAGGHPDFFLFLVIGHDTPDGTGNGVSVQGQRGAGEVGGQGHILNSTLPAGTLCIEKVCLVQLDIAPFLVALVGHGCAPAFYRNALGNELLHVSHEGVHEAVAGSQERYQQKDAPAHRKAREGRAKLVVPEGTGNLVDNLYSHYFIRGPPQAS